MKTKKRTKVLSLLLAVAMMLTMAPIMAFTSSAAETTAKDYTLFIDGMVATKNNKNGADVTLSALGITPGGNATDGYVYEFNNVNFETTAGTAIKFNNNATINLVGENTVKGGDSTDKNTYGINAKNLTIQGEGSLTITTGNTSDVCYGIYCLGKILTINGGKIVISTGSAGEENNNQGMFCKSFKMTNGEVKINSGKGFKSFGILVSDSILVEGGTLNCASGTASNTSAAVCSGGEVNAKIVDPDDGTVLSYDPTSSCYKKGENIATKATLTVKPEDYMLYIDGLNGYKNIVSETNKLTVDELTALGITPSGTAESGFVYEFNNVNFETTAGRSIKFNNNATINLVGENTIKVLEQTDKMTYGIEANNLTIQGEGSLIVVAGNTTQTFSRGIICSSLNINDGNLKVIAGNSEAGSFGVNCEFFKMTKGNVEATSGNANISYGICVSTASFLVEGGTLNCASGTASNTSAAVKVYGAANAKVVDPDSGAELTYSNGYYKKDATTVATKATLTAKPVDYTLYIVGDKGYEDGALDDVVDLSTLGITASEPTTGVFEYTFNNVNFETTAAKAIEFNNDATIKLQGENTVKGGDSESESVYGIYAGKNRLYICGGGSLAVTSGDKTDKSDSNKRQISGGIYCGYFTTTNCKLDIKSGNVNSNNHVSYSYAICSCEYHIMAGSNINCVSGNAVSTDKHTAKSICLFNDSDSEVFVVSGGKITASSGIASGNSQSVSCVGDYRSYPDTKAVDTDTQEILKIDKHYLYKKDTTIATKATLTAMPCEYNATKYVSIAKALEAIGTGTEDSHATGSIKLLDNVKEDVTIGEFQEIKLDLNGYRLENDKAKKTIDNFGKLSVIDSSTDNTGEIFSNTTSSIENNPTGELTITNIIIKTNNSTENGNAWGINNVGTCTIQGNKTEITASGCGIALAIRNPSQGTITINAGKFTASGANDHTIVLYTTNDKVTIGKDAEFILGNSTAKIQAAYYSDANYTISAGKFSGPISTYGTAKATVTGGSFTENPNAMVNSDTHKVVDNGNTYAYRYTVNEKADTTLSAPTTVTKMYDGTALYGTATPAVTTGTTVYYQTKTTADGQYAAESTDVPSITDAGTLYVKAIAKHDDYKTVSVEYTLTVTQRNVTLTSASDSKSYNETALVNKNVTVGGDGFAGAEGASYDVTGSQTQVGSSPNTFTYSCFGNTKEANYNITKVEGTLTVEEDNKFRLEKEKAKLIAALDDLGKAYDGCFATRDIRNTREAIGNYQYDESKTYEENLAAINNQFSKTAEKVVKRHDFIYGCPFITIFARMVEWILDIFKITL